MKYTPSCLIHLNKNTVICSGVIAAAMKAVVKDTENTIINIFNNLEFVKFSLTTVKNVIAGVE